MLWQLCGMPGAFLWLVVTVPGDSTPRDQHTALVSMTAREFTEQTPDAQVAILLAVIEARIELFENVAYSTSTRLFKTSEDWTSFPYGGSIPVPVNSGARYEYSSKRLNDSYRTETHRYARSGSEKSDYTVNSYDADIGQFRGTNVINDGRNRIYGAVDTEQDIVDKEDRLSYWGKGVSEPRGVFFLSDAATALDRQVAASADTTASPRISTSVRKIDNIEAIELSFRSVLSHQVGRDGILTICFDPDRQFLPIAFRLERFTGSDDVRTVRWFESMLVTDAAQYDGVWFPTRFQLLQSNALPTSTARMAAYDVQVHAVGFGSVTQSDVEFTFPAEARVVDRISEVAFIADGNGGAQVGPISIANADLSARDRIPGGDSSSITVLATNLVIASILVCGALVYRRLRRQRKG